ncbi:MAG: hypothetical protein JXQ26_04170 [Tissierellales bacterium]|nr:hypothetical protein [Tissierellales bacterium]MBN2827159.1 hypothetical protein [Tissierellales bacterium]
MEREGFIKKRRSNNRRIAVAITLFMLMTILLSACGEGGSTTDSGNMQDPYEAYGIKRGEGNLAFEILDDPPKEIAIQPIMIKKAYHEDAVFDMEPIVFKKGTSQSFSFDFQIKHESGESYPLKGTVSMKYIRDDSSNLFEIETDAYGYATLVRNGIYSNELGQHKVSGRHTSFSGFGDDPEQYLSFSLGVDKKDADKADGNMGVIYCKITGVKR